MNEVSDQDFDQWNDVKKRINRDARLPVFNQGDIWWASVGQNVGSESFGKSELYRRPVLVLKKLAAYMCIAVPLSTQPKTGTWFVDITIHGQKQYALIYQTKAMSVYRFQNRLAQLDERDMQKVRTGIKNLFEL